MNKNELKEGEIYINQTTGFLFKCRKLPSLGYTHRLHNIFRNFGNSINYEKDSSHSHYDSLREATPEQKHWLNTCISQDKFISYEKAMKSFIPEYVECIRGYTGMTTESAKIGKIYKTSEKPEFSIYKWEYLFQNHSHRFKPSTKEAYESQFKTKEVVKVKPFEILETCRKNPNRIKQVINEEGNIFMIGDIITPTITDSPNKGKGFKITGFRLNVDKSMICAITDTHTPYGIGIDKIEHFIEKDEFVLPKKWCIRWGNKENYEIIQKYLNTLNSNRWEYLMENIHARAFVTYNNDYWGSVLTPFHGFTEITFDQFKKYVLGQN